MDDEETRIRKILDLSIQDIDTFMSQFKSCHNYIDSCYKTTVITIRNLIKLSTTELDDHTKNYPGTVAIESSELKAMIIRSLKTILKQIESEEKETVITKNKKGI